MTVPGNSQFAEALADLLAAPGLFVDPERESGGAGAAPILVVDDFYRDPDAVRSLALAFDFVRYSPPDPAIVGEALAAANADRPGPWLSTALVSYHGRPAANPVPGRRHNPPELRDRMEALVGERVRRETWDSGGDCWNGAFHLLGEGYGAGAGLVHHHYKPGDVEGRGWSGLVYLSPDAPPSAGTSIWRDRRSGRCVASYGAAFERATEHFEQVLLVENRYNRLVLFRENVWHRVEHGFGSGANSRLTQTFFFEVE